MFTINNKDEDKEEISPNEQFFKIKILKEFERVDN